MTKLLFVCLGNICRSPAAEAIFKNIVSRANLSEKYIVDSAGTSGYHNGNSADARMTKHAQRRGYKITSKSRAVKDKDFQDFDYLVAMDESNYKNLHRMVEADENLKKKIVRMIDFSQELNPNEVPDPYYGGDAGFENVLDILEDACRGLFETLEY